MDNIELGKKGEEIAVNFLKEKGYIILQQNWRFCNDEIDIIKKKNLFFICIISFFIYNINSKYIINLKKYFIRGIIF